MAYTGSTKKEAMLKAILGTCKPCCGAGSGSGSSGSGVPFPNGCLPCDCRQCICYWYTDWHKSITVDSFLYEYNPLAPWKLVSHTLTRIGGTPDYMYFAVIDPTACSLSGVFAVDENNDVTDNIAYVPKWSGEMVYTNGVDTVTFDVVFALQFQLQIGCDEPSVLVDSAVWFGPESAISDPPGYSFSGAAIFDGILNTSVDIGLPEDISPGNGTLVDGSGTVDLGYNFPPLTITAMFQPGC